MLGRRPKLNSFKRVEDNPGNRILGSRHPIPGLSKNAAPSWLPENGKHNWNDLHPLLEGVKKITKANDGGAPNADFIEKIGRGERI